MDDAEILTRISSLVDEEHHLRERAQAGDEDREDEATRLAHLEEQLDQCWDLLRQRRARRQRGEDPDDATARDVGTVEHYLQ